MDSILTTIKKLLGITEDCEQFDQDIIIAINSSILTLTQIGVGPEEGFMITDKNSKWSDFYDGTLLEAVKSWIHLKVRLIFDPPTSSILKESIEANLKELEWRIGIVADPVPDEFKK